MGTTLTGTTPQDTYDSLIKVTDNGPLSGTAKYLSDGLGNDSALALSTSNVGIGTASPSAFTGYSTLALNGSNGGLLEFKKGDVQQAYITNAGDPLLQFYTNGNEQVKITSDRYIRMASGTGGIQFNGDTAAANALDDYEEGTWTMGVSFGGASVGVTTSSNTGTYTKIGRQVTVNGYLVLTSKGSSTGVVEITGLPFTIENNSEYYSSASLWFRNITFANQFQGYGNIGGTNISLKEITEAGAETWITNADFANNSQLILSLTYFV